VVAALLLICGGGGYALFKVLNPVVPGSATPPVSLATPTNSPVPTVPPTSAPDRPTSFPTTKPEPAETRVPQVADLGLFLGGGPFEEPYVLEAIALSVPWAGVSEEFFSAYGQEILITVEAQGQEYALSTDVEYDPDKAIEMLADVGYPEGFPVLLLYTVDDEPLQFLAEVMTQHLGDTGFQIVELMGMPVAEGHAKALTLVAAGETVMWLHRR
jgi:ABC-type transport system substrate-binding protein